MYIESEIHARTHARTHACTHTRDIKRKRETCPPPHTHTHVSLKAKPTKCRKYAFSTLHPQEKILKSASIQQIALIAAVAGYSLTYIYSRWEELKRELVKAPPGAVLCNTALALVAAVAGYSRATPHPPPFLHTPAYASIRQHTPACIREHT